ncbi:MAG: hypothetical protein WCS70_07395 [Verrucomicrobiota bacterium]
MFELKQHLRTLALIEPSESPVISCYLDLTASPGARRAFLGNQAVRIRAVLPAEQQVGFDEAVTRVVNQLGKLSPTALSAAVFARGGKQPVFTALEFGVPLPNWFAVQPTPNIYHLVELKDTYHRYVLVILTTRLARILEVNLGAVTEELWRVRPDLRDRVGSGWTREQYRHHRTQQTAEYIAEKIKILSQLMAAGGHSHLVLAGEPALVTPLRDALPRHLAAKVVDVVESAGRSDDAVVATTLARFVEAEAHAELRIVEELQRGISRGGLAVAGTAAVLQALRRQQVDVLLIDQDYRGEAGWSCGACGAMVVAASAPAQCPNCQHGEWLTVVVKEELVRLAVRQGAGVEVVIGNAALREMGGVGCLLRYMRAEQFVG